MHFACCPRSVDRRIPRSLRFYLLTVWTMLFSLTLPTHLFPFFFFNDPATPEFYPLSLHDALPISRAHPGRLERWRGGRRGERLRPAGARHGRRRLDSHPRRILRRVRLQAVVRPRAGGARVP